MSLPRLFAPRHEEKAGTPRVTTVRSGHDKQVNEVIEAGLYPARVASRNGAKLVQFALKIAVLVLLVVMLASSFGLIDPIRRYFQPFSGGTGGLVVSSEYVRAQVFLDGKLIGQTPYTGENLPAGTHIIKVQVAENTSDFFKAAELPVLITSGNTTVVKTNPAPEESLFSYTVISSANTETSGDALLVIKALPQDVKVTIDGTAVGVTPYTSDTIAEGAHQVLLEKLGYKPVLIDVSVSKGKTVTVNSKLYQYQVNLEK